MVQAAKIPIVLYLAKRHWGSVAPFALFTEQDVC